MESEVAKRESNDVVDVNSSVSVQSSVINMAEALRRIGA